MGPFALGHLPPNPKPQASYSISCSFVLCALALRPLKAGPGGGLSVSSHRGRSHDIMVVLLLGVGVGALDCQLEILFILHWDYVRLFRIRMNLACRDAGHGLAMRQHNPDMLGWCFVLVVCSAIFCRSVKHGAHHSVWMSTLLRIPFESPSNLYGEAAAEHRAAAANRKKARMICSGKDVK